MPKILTVLLAFIFFSLFFTTQVKADFNSAYQDYVFRQQQYKTAHNAYQVARSSYQTYGTLTSENEAIAKFKEILKARDELIFSYFNLLQEKLNATEGVSNESKVTFNGIRQSEQSWLKSHMTQIDAAANLDDLNTVSQEFEDRYEQMDTETKQAIGSILIAKEKALRDKLNVALLKSVSKLSEVRNSGINTEVADRGIITIQNKLSFQDLKVNEAQQIFSEQPKSSRREGVNLLKGQKTLIEANQYLKEASSYLLEIIRSYTG